MGTWTLPQTKTQAVLLRLLLQQPILAKNAQDILNPLFGDDDLFDVILHIKNQHGPDTDVRVTVKFFLADALVGKALAYKPWDEDAYATLCAECRDYLPLAQFMRMMLGPHGES